MVPSPPRGARTRARLTVERLRDLYPAVTELRHENPFELLIATILSAQTTDRSVNLVTPELFRRYPTAADLAAADPAVVETLIKPTGFFRAKTKRIIAASRKLVEMFGGVVPSNIDDLTKIPGIGRKTANVILGAGFGVPGFAVSTHVIRLRNRPVLARTKAQARRRRLPRGRVQVSAQPRKEHGLRLVAEPVYRLRAPLRLLLRPGV